MKFLTLSSILSLSLLLAACSSTAPTSTKPTTVYTTNQPMTCGAEKNPNIYHQLNYGLYWFGKDNQCQQFNATHKNRYFDPNKKKVLFVIHGWMIGATQKHRRLNFDATRLHGPNVTDALAAWTKNWNVGMFYWNQFSDEAPLHKIQLLNAVAAAEAKIWSTKGVVGMRWRDDKGNYYVSDLQQSIAATFYQQYVQALAHYQGDEIRIMGQSLGTQVAIALTALIYQHVEKGDIPKNLLPKQVILLDPAFSGKNNDLLGNGKTLMQQAISDVKTLKKAGVVFSGYRSSKAGHNRFMADNTPLLNLTAFSDFQLNYYPEKDILDRHTMGIWWYLLSMPNAAKQLAVDTKSPYAGMPLAQLRQLMESDSYKQVTFAKAPSLLVAK